MNATHPALVDFINAAKDIVVELRRIVDNVQSGKLRHSEAFILIGALKDELESHRKTFPKDYIGSLEVILGYCEKANTKIKHSLS